ncbi:MAG: gluconate 2-dehydrogenase subunit 3 family protein [Thermoanaerobaculia bacterium]
MRNWTRRRFLVAAAAGTAAVSGAVRAAATSTTARSDVSSAWPDSVGAVLRAAMDVIVPAADGMPAAGEAGVSEYLELVAIRDMDVNRQLRRAASALEKRARPSPFASLPGERRVRVVAELEAKEPAVFESLRDFVYEGYYTRPEVWKRLGFVFYRPDRPGPGIPPFDETSVARVRARSALYRKAT